MLTAADAPRAPERDERIEHVIGTNVTPCTIPEQSRWRVTELSSQDTEAFGAPR